MSNNNLTKLPKKFINLSNLVVLRLSGNPHLTLTQKQKEWIRSLEIDGCELRLDYDLLDRAESTQLSHDTKHDDGIPF